MIDDATPLDQPAAGESANAPARFRIRLAADAGAEQLAEALVGAGWGLLEMATERTDLERVFFRCIGAEEPA